MLAFVDGSVADVATISVGVLAVLVRPAKRAAKKSGPCFDRKSCVIDFLNGTTIVPFFLLLLSAISSVVLKEVMAANKMSLGLAGAVGLIFVVAEVFSAT